MFEIARMLKWKITEEVWRKGGWHGVLDANGRFGKRPTLPSCLMNRPHFDTLFDSDENEGAIRRAFLMARQLLGDTE